MKLFLAVALASMLAVCTTASTPPKPAPKPRPPATAYGRMLLKEATDHAVFCIHDEYLRDAQMRQEEAEAANFQRTVDDRFAALLDGRSASGTGTSRPSAWGRVVEKDTPERDKSERVWQEDVMWLTTHNAPKGVRPYTPKSCEELENAREARRAAEEEK